MIEVWKLSERDTYFVRFAPEDTLVFDIRMLTADQKRCVDEAYPELRGVMSLPSPQLLEDHRAYELLSSSANPDNR